MPLYRNTYRFGIILVSLFLFTLTSLAFAQDAAPLQLGQNAIGELTANAPTASFAITASGGESVAVQVLALSPNLIPRFRVLNPSGVEILVAPNPNALSSLTADASFPDAGTYIIEVSGENDTLGQFVISLQAGAPLPAAVELAADQPVSGTVSSETPLALYHFSTTAEITSLTIISQLPDTGVLVSLHDETAGKTSLTSDAAIRAARYQLAAEDRSYRLEIHASNADATPYTVCLGDCSGGFLASQSPQQPTVNTTPEVVALACTVASAITGSVNVRSGAGTEFTIIGNLSPAQPLPAIGRLANSSWIQVNLPNGQQGWVGSSVTRLEGDCAALPVVAAPLNAALAPTQPPAPTNPPPTTASSGGGTAPTTAPTTEPPPAVTLPDLSAAFANVTVDDSSVEVNFVVSLTGIPLPDGLTYEICLDGSCYSFGYAPLVVGNNPIRVLMSPSLINPRRVVHQITVTVDSTDLIAESNESNNVATYNFQT